MILLSCFCCAKPVASGVVPKDLGPAGRGRAKLNDLEIPRDMQIHVVLVDCCDAREAKTSCMSHVDSQVSELYDAASHPTIAVLPCRSLCRSQTLRVKVAQLHHFFIDLNRWGSPGMGHGLGSGACGLSKGSAKESKDPKQTLPMRSQVYFIVFQCM